MDEPEDVVLDAYSDAFDAGTQDIEQPEEPIPKAKDSGAKITQLYHRSVAPRHQPLLVEEQVQFEINERPYQTYIDLVDDKKTVRDLKTSLRMPSRAGHILQLVAGAIGFRNKTGMVETDTAIDVLVRTSKPYYAEIAWGGPVDQLALGVLATQIKTADDMVQRGYFPANGLASYACSWCGYRNICPAFKAAYGARP